MLTLLEERPYIILSFLEALFESVNVFLTIIVAANASLTLRQILGGHDTKIDLSVLGHLGHDGLTQRHVTEIVPIYIVF